MAHDHVYGVCESKCFVEVPTKAEYEENEEIVSAGIAAINGKFNVVTVPADSEITEIELGTNLPFITEVINLKAASITVKFSKPEEAESVDLKFGYIKSGAALTEVTETVTTSYTLTLEAGKRLIIYGNV